MSEVSKGLTDKSVPPSGGKTLVDKIEPGNLAHQINAAQYDNPRGYPGLAGLQLNRKGPRIIDHNVHHEMEKEGSLARTGDPRFSASGGRTTTKDPRTAANRLTGRSVADF